MCNGNIVHTEMKIHSKSAQLLVFFSTFIFPRINSGDGIFLKEEEEEKNAGP